MSGAERSRRTPRPPRARSRPTLINPSPEAACVLPGTVTATGTLAQNITAGGANKTFLVTLTPGSCPFQLSTASGNPLVFATDSDGKNITTAPAVVAGQQNSTDHRPVPRTLTTSVRPSRRLA